MVKLQTPVNGMELRHIRYFIAVAREGNFTRAASRLGIAQPPLSLQIKALEQEVGAVLFRRGAYGAELTAAGQAFLKTVEGMPALSEQAIKQAQRAARGEVGALRAGYCASAAFNKVVPGTIRAFRRAYPDVELLLEESNTTRLLAGLHDGTVDIAFLRPALTDLADLQVRSLSNEQLILALPASHAACGERSIDLTTLASEPFLLFPRSIGPTLYDTIVAACTQAGFEPQVHQLAPQFPSIVNLVAVEIGIALMPVSMEQVHSAGVVFRAVKGKLPNAGLSLAYRKGDASKLVRNFMAVAVSN
jgi:DNA-binding transcriptional LysR family regulator